LNGIHTEFWRNRNKGHCPAAAQNVSPGIMRMRRTVTVGLDSVTLGLGHWSCLSKTTKPYELASFYFYNFPSSHKFDT
jgi:hypothetical protein